MIQRTKELVDQISGDMPEVKDLLDRDLERVERLTRKMKNDNDQYVDIFVHAGNSLLHVIVMKGIKCILSETVYKIDQDKNLPKVLQPNVEEIKSHLRSFEAKLDQVETSEKNLNKMIEKILSRDSVKMTEKEEKTFKMMLVDMETGIELAKINEEKTREALKLFNSGIKSYQKENNSRSWGNIGLGAIAGGVVGAAITLLSGPVGWMALGPVSGGVITAWYDRYGESEYLEQLLLTEANKLRTELEILSLRSKEAIEKNIQMKKKNELLNKP